MRKKERAKRLTMTYKTLRRQQKIGKHEPHKIKPGVNACSPKKEASSSFSRMSYTVCFLGNSDGRSSTRK
jgi:hypothetical protein